MARVTALRAPRCGTCNGFGRVIWRPNEQAVPVWIVCPECGEKAA